MTVALHSVAIATFKLKRKPPYKKMLIVTGVLLTAVLAIMVGKTVRTMQGVGWLPITPSGTELPIGPASGSASFRQPKPSSPR